MKKRLLLSITLIFTAVFIIPSAAQTLKKGPLAVKGRIAVTTEDLRSFSTVKLDGEWEFYWNQLLNPSDFTAKKVPELTAYPNVPGCWDSKSPGIPAFPAKGAATYRLKVQVEDPDILYGFIVPETLTSYKLWINGKVAASAGTVSLIPEEMQPQTVKRIVYIRPDSTDIEIVWQVADSSYRKSGIWLSMQMGLARSVAAVHDWNIGVEIFLAGCLLIMALYHIGLFIYRRHDRTPLYFGLFCLVIVLRILTTGELLLETIFPDFSWEIARKMEFSPFYIGGTFFMLFLYSVFPQDISRKIVTGLAVAAGSMGLFVIVTPVRIGNYLVLPMEIVTLTGLVYLMTRIIVSVIRKREGALYIFFGFMTIIIASVNDVLFSNGLLPTFYMVPLGLLILIFSQSLMLAMRFSQSFTRVEVLSESLTDINVSMKRFVPYEFLNYLGKQSIVEVEIGDQTQQEMTVFFSDIRAFTSTAEKMTPQEVINFLNAYLSLIAPVIRVHKGFIDKFIGDAVMALFPSGEETAIDAAIAVHKLLRIYNAENEGKPGFPIRLGIGLHTGKLMLGTIGDRGRLDTTVISDAVNLASRIESLTKSYGAGILVSEDVLSKVRNKDKYSIRYVDRVAVKGKTEPVTIIEILEGLPDEEKEIKLATKADFEHAVNFYQSGNLTVARNLLHKILRKNPDDRAASLYLSRCNDRRKNRNSHFCDGVEVLDFK